MELGWYGESFDDGGGYGVGEDWWKEMWWIGCVERKDWVVVERFSCWDCEEFERVVVVGVFICGGEWRFEYDGEEFGGGGLEGDGGKVG